MRTVLFITIFSFLAACGDDTASPSTMNDAGDDAQQNNTSNNVNNAQDVGQQDTANDEGNGTDAGRDLATDTSSDVAIDANDMSFPDVTSQPCTHPTTDPNCPMGEFGPATFLDTVEVVLDNTCCRDMTGDGTFDNRMGSILAAVVGFGLDINQDIAANIQAGRLVYLVEFANWENETFDSSLDATVYLGVDEDQDFTDNLAGTGNFLVTPDNFDEVTGDPLSPFETTQVLNSRLNAQRGVIDLRFPGLLPEVEIITTDLQLTADVDPNSILESGGRVTITNGELSGAILRNRFFQSLNEAAVGCACIGREIFTPEGDGSFNCDLNAAEEMLCLTDPEAGCRLMGQTMSCSLWGQLGGTTDVDTNGDGENDAFSIGLRVTGVGASITDRVPDL